MWALVLEAEGRPRAERVRRSHELLQAVGLDPGSLRGGIRISFPEGSGSAWGWRGRWRRTRRFC